MTDKIKQFEIKIREQIKEAAELLSVRGEAPSPAAVLAMIGYQMYMDNFYLNPQRLKETMSYLMLGYEMAKEDELNDLTEELSSN
jgi:hypothetical protein